MRSKCIQEWAADIADTSKHPILRTYIYIKSSFRNELINDKLYCRAISQLSCSSHILNVEKGRYTKPRTLLVERLCNYVDDELHFINACVVNVNERRTLCVYTWACVPASYRRLSSLCYWVFIFEVKLAFEMLTVLGQQHSFLTHERVFLGQCQRFWDRKCLDLRGTRPPIFGYMPNALTCWVIWARHLLSLVVEYWLWRYRYFLSKVNIWNVNCARATESLSTHERAVLGKCQSFWDRKMSRPEGESNQ